MSFPSGDTATIELEPALALHPFRNPHEKPSSYTPLSYSHFDYSTFDNSSSFALGASPASTAVPEYARTVQRHILDWVSCSLQAYYFDSWAEHIGNHIFNAPPKCAESRHQSKPNIFAFSTEKTVQQKILSLAYDHSAGKEQIVVVEWDKPRSFRAWVEGLVPAQVLQDGNISLGVSKSQVEESGDE
ncbi:uncharacterized protein DFL_001407 [Arthrobotrys flagrans]|uniref:Uncharacterized protein n=1 Tax=Arthrobotrys flagrans TaxID=97331 RepID=A0A437AH10_ARTFL|nr:hypothetical protein DFL_001407 [Arthrobotrys flagrans]